MSTGTANFLEEGRVSADLDTRSGFNEGVAVTGDTADSGKRRGAAPREPLPRSPGILAAGTVPELEIPSRPVSVSRRNLCKSARISDAC
jgi:hypothetical protein